MVKGHPNMMKKDLIHAAAITVASLATSQEIVLNLENLAHLEEELREIKAVEAVVIIAEIWIILQEIAQIQEKNVKESQTIMVNLLVVIIMKKEVQETKLNVTIVAKLDIFQEIAQLSKSVQQIKKNLTQSRLEVEAEVLARKVVEALANPVKVHTPLRAEASQAKVQRRRNELKRENFFKNQFKINVQNGWFCSCL